MRLDDSAREWLALRRDRLRSAAVSCDAASREWSRRNDELSDLARRSGWDALKTSRVMAQNEGLNSAYAAWNFWQQEVRRLAADIQAELAYRTLMAADDPMLYDRGDDEGPDPAAPVREHYGFAPTGREQRPTNSPAGYASTERRTLQIESRPGSKQPTRVPGGSPVGTGAAGLRGPAAPTLRGGAA